MAGSTASEALADAARIAAVALGDGAGRGAELVAAVASRIDQALVSPARELVERPSKGFRARLVRIAYELARADAAGGAAAEPQVAARAATAIELLHAGSLIVDDIQDGSPMRRGGASLHRAHGVPRALCTGNWLYFAALGLLRGLGLAPSGELRLFRAYHEALEAAHLGQALDLTVCVTQLPLGEIAPVCRAVAALKTGSLASLAMRVGAVVGGADEARGEALARFGARFGAALQELDDAGNAAGIDPEKRQEDLAARKPAAVWAFAAAERERYARLVAAVASLPQDAALRAWLADTGYLVAAEAAAQVELADARAALAREIGGAEAAWRELDALQLELLGAYRSVAGGAA